MTPTLPQPDWNFNLISSEIKYYLRPIGPVNNEHGSYLLKDNILEYIYEPTLNLVNHTKKLGVPVICFPRGISDYKKFCEFVNPDMVSIDYNVDPKKIIKEVKIPIQGGLDPKTLLTDEETLKKETEKYLNIFKDHPYVFNLGHGILPNTPIEMVEELVKTVRDFKWIQTTQKLTLEKLVF